MRAVPDQAAERQGGTARPLPPAAHAPRLTAWRESLVRVRAAATTEPGRLRLIGAAVAALVLAFGAVTAWQVAERQSAAGNVIDHSAPLSANAAEIYRSLADADATVAGGFLVGGEEPKKVSDRYRNDITTAAELIADAAANSAGSPQARTQIATLNSQLPQYTELVATAQADNRQGLPLGGAYLRYADAQMRKQGGLLDAADKLYQAENGRLGADYSDAKAMPYVSWALGVIALAALVWAQRRHYRRTNRVFNQGLLTATAATAVVLVWLVAAHTVARNDLADSSTHGAKSIQVLNNARTEVLQARGDENLTLVARGSGDEYEKNFTQEMEALAGKGSGATAADGSELAQALALADKEAGRAPVRSAIADLAEWRQRHTSERAADDGGDYTTAVAEVIGGKNSSGAQVTETTGKTFDAVDTSLGQAVAQEQKEFHQAATDGRGALALLPFGAGVLAVLAAAAALVGIGRRLSEYR
ncbi:putative secreted protein [Actinacidiphila reveromycinica]|uniref:Putative secreted protein n=1 Tax=Actinacidiphila reveromycinica TaxID=659352 RepID=A0A7U3VNA6_9ACTN|nr:putative secreted protein [Streptomyces sp. SN-593]